MWEANGQGEEVALYVRALAFAERPKAAVSSRVLVRQLQEALGLSLPGLARLHWKIATSPAPAAPPRQPSEPGDVVDIRSRMRDVGGAS